MTLRLTALAHDARDPARVAAFWAALLARDVVEDERGFLVPGSDTQVGLLFVASTSEKREVSAVHLHVSSEEAEDQQAVVDHALSLGAAHADVGQLPEEKHVVLADPEGNEFCVIEPENDYLRGCGPLAELACDGLRRTGLFWSEALGWPLVWDQDEETAIQASAGGTKVAWGGPPLDPKRGRDRQRFALEGSVGDVERLVGLGAMRLDGSGGLVELTDPDGHEFTVTT